MWSQRSEDHVGFFYRPLFSVWLLVFYSIAGAAPWTWHLASIGLHVSATFLVFKLIAKLLRNELAASIGALLFAMHPIHIEAVSWVSSANELLYTICILGSLLLLEESRAGTWNSKAWGALTLWAAALFFKETALALLIVFPFLIWAKLGTTSENELRNKRTIVWCIPWLVTAGIFIGIRTLILQRSGLESGKQPWREALFSVPGLLVFYLKKLVLPWNLSSFYFEDLADGAGFRVLVAIAVILVLLSLFLYAAYKKHDSVALSGAIVVLPLLPILGGLRVYQQGDIAHDRYLYLPSVALCLLVAILVDRLLTNSRKWKPLITGIVVIVFSAATYLCLSQQSWYADDQFYYGRAVALYPQDFVAWELWGRFNLAHKHPKEGLDEVTQAYHLAPNDPNVDYYYARALFENGRYPDAEPLLKQLSRPTTLNGGRQQIVLLAFAETEIKLGKLGDAEQVLDLLEQLNAVFPGLHNTRGNLYELEGNLSGAKEEFLKEFKITGDVRSKRAALALDAGNGVN
jgi:tetratricopeptide (TPR) repeat protein